jgi:[ribosomal protein S5]-alanine N-acetyltransferase
VIETERLLIRPLSPEETEGLFVQTVDPANERIDFAPERPSDEQVRRWMEGTWGVFERESGELVGDCTLFFDDGHQEWELAYGFRRDRWGRGYATEAGEACVQYGFEVLGVEKIVADVDPKNPASVRVLEKLGFRRTGGTDEKLLYERTR